MPLRHTRYHGLNRILRRLRPVRRLPIWVRYSATTVLVLAFFGLRYLLEDVYHYPFLMFLPAIVISAIVFDRGSGFLATLLSAALAIYFFIEPRTTFEIGDIATVVAVLLFTTVGGLLATLIEALRNIIEELTAAYDQLNQRDEELRESFHLLEAVIEGVPDAIFVKDEEGRFLHLNSEAARVFGAPRNVLIGNRAREFLPPDTAEKIESVDRTVMRARTPLVTEELTPVAGAGEPRWFLYTTAPRFGANGKVIGVVGIARDIHERKLAEEEVRAASAQKDLLLHDINHRVKNHLQSVMAMLSLSRRQVKDEAAREALENTTKRLSVLARVYDRLQLKGASGEVVSVRDYVESLCADLAPTLTGVRPVALRVQVEETDLDASRAVSVGLIINEALTNAFKYAFPGDREGTVSVNFRRDEHQFQLEITDNGVGKGPASERPSGIGSTLIRSLAQQLGGGAEWDWSSGTSVRVIFPVRPPGHEGGARAPQRKPQGI